MVKDIIVFICIFAMCFCLVNIAFILFSVFYIKFKLFNSARSFFKKKRKIIKLENNKKNKTNIMKLKFFVFELLSIIYKEKEIDDYDKNSIKLDSLNDNDIITCLIKLKPFDDKYKDMYLCISSRYNSEIHNLVKENNIHENDELLEKMVDYMNDLEYECYVEDGVHEYYQIYTNYNLDKLIMLYKNISGHFRSLFKFRDDVNYLDRLISSAFFSKTNCIKFLYAFSDHFLSGNKDFDNIVDSYYVYSKANGELYYDYILDNLNDYFKEERE